MKKTLTTAFLFGATFLVVSNASAAQIENLDVTPTGTQILIEWDKLTDSEMYDETGYALQWSTTQNDIRNDKMYRTTTKPSTNTLTLRAAGFDKEETYYFRAYSLSKDGRNWNLNNGSKILKWVWRTNGDVESEFVAANDPVVVDNDSSISTYSFGNLNAIEYDSSIQFSWSSPTLTSSEYDGFSLVISQENDLSNPVAEISIPDSMTKAFVEGLTPNTKYYAAGYFKNGSKLFGKSPTKEMATLPAFSTSKKSRYEKYVIKKGNLGFRYSLDGATSATTTSTISSTTSTTSTEKVDTTDEVEVKARIAELKKLIKTYQSELSTLTRTSRTFGASSSTTTSSRTTTSTSTKRVNSIAERLRARLAAKNK